MPDGTKTAYLEASQWKKFPYIEEMTIEETPVTDIIVSKSFVSLTVGESETLEYSIIPVDATNKNVQWISVNPSIATVTNSGKITAISIGETYVIVSTVDGSNVSTVIKVKVNPVQITLPMTVKIVASGTTTLKDGQTVRLYAEVYPETATDKSVIWQSDDEAIATVEDGWVTAHSKLGIAHITATASNGVKGEIEIEVVATPVKSINFTYNQLHLLEGQSKTLEVEILPYNATNKTLAWSVSDESILSVDDNGVITALKSGKAYVFAVANNDVYASLPIIVDKPIERIELESNYTVPLYTDDYGQIFISELKLEPKIYPDDAYVKNLKWTSSNESVGKVISSDNKNYTFYAYKPGKTTLTCKVTDGSDVTATCEVEVILFSEEIAFSMDGHVLERESTVYVKSGETVLINVTFYLKPTNPRYDDPTMNFSSDIIEVTELSQEPLDSFVSGYKRRYAVKGLSVGETAFVFFAYNTAGRIWIDVTDNSGIEQPEVDESLVRPIYYDLQGNKISGMNLLPGIYIKKTGPTIEKVFIR